MTENRVHNKQKIVKVVLLEASVRALETNVVSASSLGHHDDLINSWRDQGLSPVSSSFSSVLSMAGATTTTTTTSNGSTIERASCLPRRHHTIGNIRYDSSAYKTVSFQEDEEPKSDRGGAGMFRHMKHDAADQECEEDKVQNSKDSDLNDHSVARDNDNDQANVVQDELLTVEEKTDVQLLEDVKTDDSIDDSSLINNDEDDDVVSNLRFDENRSGLRAVTSSSNISRSKSFNDVTVPKQADDESWLVASPCPDNIALRSKSFKDISSSKKPNRFSWDADSMSLGGAGSLQNMPSHLRSSLASLASLDVASSPGGPISLDISSRDLTLKRGTLSGYLELKRNSGFKTYKRYFCVLDGPILYIYSRDKDPKAKQAMHLGGFSVKALKVVESGSGLGGSFRSEVKKKGRQFELIPPTGAKDTRLFAAGTKEEAATWVQRLQEAIDSVKVILSEESIGEDVNGCRPVDPLETVTTPEDIFDEAVVFEKEHLHFWHQNNKSSRSPVKKSVSQESLIWPVVKYGESCNWKVMTKIDSAATFDRYWQIFVWCCNPSLFACITGPCSLKRP